MSVAPEPGLQLAEGRRLRLGDQPGPDVVTVGVPPVQAGPGGLHHHLVPHGDRPALLLLPGLDPLQLVLQHGRAGGVPDWQSLGVVVSLSVLALAHTGRAGSPRPPLASWRQLRGRRRRRRRGHGGAGRGDVGVLQGGGGGQDRGNINWNLDTSTSTGALNLEINQNSIELKSIQSRSRHLNWDVSSSVISGLTVADAAVLELMI